MSSENNSKSIGPFEKYLTLWVLLCIAVGIVTGALFGENIQVLSQFTFYYVNIPVAILIWAMIYPMMLQIDFASLKEVGKTPKGVIWTVVINCSLNHLL